MLQLQLFIVVFAFHEISNNQQHFICICSVAMCMYIRVCMYSNMSREIEEIKEKWIIVTTGVQLFNYEIWIFRHLI